MKIKRVISPFLEANCYIITIDDNTIIVDPCVDIKTLSALNIKRIKAILLTHGHIDHFDKLYTYLDSPMLTNDFKVYCHPKALEKINSGVKNCASLCGITKLFSYSFEHFKTIISGKIDLNIENKVESITVFSNPGHTDCSISFLLDSALFTGDFIFEKGIGRTDLYSGNMFMMNNSLKMIANLKEDYVIYPGHGNQQHSILKRKTILT